MKYKKLKKFIDEIALYEAALTEEQLDYILLKYFYENSKIDLMETILQLNKMDREKLEKDINIKWQGLSDATNYLSESNFLKKNKDSKSIPHLIRIIIGMYPKGKVSADRGSLFHKEFFNNFKEQLLKESHKYLNGESKDWAQRHGYYEYIKMIVEQYSDNK